MIVYGKSFVLGVMHSDTKQIVAVTCSLAHAAAIRNALNKTTGETHEAISLGQFERKYCEPIKGRDYA